MSGLLVDGSELVKTQAAFQRFYANLTGNTPTFVTGRQFGTALKGPDSGATPSKWDYDHQAHTGDDPTHATWVYGAAMKWHTLLGGGNGDGPIVAFVDGSTEQVSLQIVKGGAGGSQIKLQVYRGGDGGTLLGETAFILELETWYYIEFKATIDNTTGAYDVRVNENSVLSASGVDTQVTANASADILRLWARPGDFDAGHHFDDQYLLNGAGTLNDFQGDSVVEAVRPSSEASPNQWTASSGVDNSAMIDDDDPDDDASYIFSTTGDQEDLHNMGDISQIDNDNIPMVHLKLIPRLTLSGTRDVKSRWKQGAAVDGETHTVNDTAYKYRTEIQEDDPTDSNPWTRAKVNSLVLGVKSV